MKKFSIPCDFGGKKSPFDVFIGNPKAGNHPLVNQSNWLQSERGGTIPPDIWESFAKLLELSEKNGVPFEDLCAYALEKSNANNSKTAKKPVANTAKKEIPAATNNQGAMKVATAKVPASQVSDSDPNKKAAIVAQAAKQAQTAAAAPQAQPAVKQTQTAAPKQAAIPKPAAKQTQAAAPKPAVPKQAAPVTPKPAAPKPAAAQPAAAQPPRPAAPLTPKPAAPKPAAPQPATSQVNPNDKAQ